MTLWDTSSINRTFATPELLEHILTYLLVHLLPLTDQEDPRSVRTRANAQVLMHLLRCSEVSQSWRQCMQGSKHLQTALFLLPNTKTNRTWQQRPGYGCAQAAQVRLASYYRAPPLRAPALNAVIQTTFPSYHFRFWHLSLEATGHKHCAYMIITRRDMPSMRAIETHSISNMLLSAPPCTVLEATIWEERDETKEYVGRTSVLEDPLIQSAEGLTLGTVHRRVTEMFAEHLDVAAIKLTTT